MLVEVTIKNFAIIEELTVSFNEGLTVLTGETGAGKSIIIDAIGLLIGGRGSVEYVRHGADRAEIEGLYIVEEGHPAIEKMTEAGIEIEENMIVIRREITKKGKSVCRLNGKLVTLALLREIGQTLIDIHGQHEHQELMHRERHLDILDRFAGKDLQETLHDYREIYKAFTTIEKQLKQLKENDQEAANRLDFIEFQLDEIEKAELTPDEDENLEQERKILANSEKLFKSLRDAYESLYGEGRALDWTGLAVNHGEEAAAIDPNIQETIESVNSAFYMLEEATYAIRDRVETLEFDPERLHHIENRLDEIQHLKRKYGQTVTDILEYASKIEEERDFLLNKEEKLDEMEQKLATIAHDLYVEAKTLTDIRQQAAERLSNKVKQELQALYMESASLVVNLSEAEKGKSYAFERETVHFHDLGKDKAEFLLSTNTGEPLKPLAKIASGGEISRMMLALKTILSNFQHVTSLIFDEVDTGVSGRVAQAIAERIHQVSIGSQVLCITHLPQVAAMADTHLYIEKNEEAGRVVTSVRPLSREEKVDEIARMISGVEVTELTLEHANELLHMAKKITSKT